MLSESISILLQLATNVPAIGRVVNWWDVTIGTLSLAIIPLFLAAYGGHLAAKTIAEPRQQTLAKLYFWGACILGILFIFVQQYRSSESDVRKDALAQEQRAKLESVWSQNSSILHTLTQQQTKTPDQAAVERRRQILAALRNEYILSHDDISVGMLAGTEQPPAKWINDRLKALGEQWILSTQQSSQMLRKPSLPDSPRLGTGPDAYSKITDEQIGNWAIAEADKIDQMANYAMTPNPGWPTNPHHQSLRFSNDLKACCMEDLRQLRAELLRRLGPPAKDPDEISAWTALFPELKHPAMDDDVYSSLVFAKPYTRYLRRFGLQLLHRATPRTPLLALKFSQVQTVSEPQGGSLMRYSVVVTVSVPHELKIGYIVSEFDQEVGSLSSDLQGSSVLFGPDANLVDNNELSRLAQSQKHYILELGSTASLTPATPFHVLASSIYPIHGLRVTWFDR